ncbi:MAG: dehydro coenzyme reductase / coenzyme F420-0:L-glutamate ligase / coenzyme [Actinomycetota bacterium]|nr:dehydro coenzyme reductase / coenzyme F420-0:L-glutamate ligase / coenzyme [Actinomycetota bacterium]
MTDIVALNGLPEILPGTDLVALLAEALHPLDPKDGEVLAVTSKIVSKAEGRLVPGTDRRRWVESETVRVVARRGDLVIAETAHGFVCANAGVDASNLDAGILALLPVDPDASAERLREGLHQRLGVRLGVVITDTFGRPWRNGLVNVAVGSAGLPSIVDLRETPDHNGRPLEMTVVAFADELAAASGLVMPKAGRIPAALIRDVERPAAAPDAPASALVRPPGEDLFRASPLQAIHDRRTLRAFGDGPVSRDAIEAAVQAACTAPAPHHARPWRFVVLESAAAKRHLLGAIAGAWRADLREDDTAEDVIERRIARSDAVLGAAPVLIVPFVRFAGAHPYPDGERSGAERDMFLLSGGAAIQSLLLGLSAQNVASCWISSTLFCQEETRYALGLGDEWFALGTVAAGPMPEGGASRPRPPMELDDFLTWS